MPENYPEVFAANITSHAFRSLDENSFDDRSLGWVNVMDIFDSTFAGREFFKEPYLALAWRVDVRRVPANALKQHCREAEKEIMAREELEYLPRGRRREIKEMVHGRLLRRAIPNAKTYDMVWRLPSGVLLFGSLNSKLCDEFSACFFDTFGLHLAPVFPYTMACGALEKAGRPADLVDSLASTDLTEGG